MRLLGTATALVLVVPLALGAASGTDPAGDTDWIQTAPGGPDLMAPLGCSDPMMDVRSFHVWTDGDRLRGSLNVTDGDGQPSCLAGTVPMFRLEGFLAMRFVVSPTKTGVLGYDVNDLCVFTIWDGAFAATYTYLPDETCHRFGNEFRFNVSANATVGSTSYDFRGSSFDVHVTTAEQVGFLPIRVSGITPQGRIHDFAD